MELPSRQLELDQIFNRFAGSAVPPPPPVAMDRTEWSQQDQDLCAYIVGSKQGERFQKLFAGRFDEYGSQSEADFALCNVLAYWCGKDDRQIDRIFRQSKLYRPKWDERHGAHTYGQTTIQKAIVWIDNASYEGKTPSTTLPPQDEWFLKALENAGAGRFIDYDPPELDWVFCKSLLVKTVGALVGPGAVGKSTLMLEMLISIATGRDILPGIFKPARTGKVLAIFAEEDELILHHRFKGLVDALFPFDDQAKELLKENMLLIPAAGHDLRILATSPMGETANAFFNVLLEAVKKIPDLRLIAVDPLSRFFGADENDNGAATFFVSMLEQIAQATGAAIIVCHHVGKRSAFSSGEFNLEAAMHQDSARGASAITNGVRWQCNIVGLPETAAKKIVQAKDAKPGQFLALQVSKKNYGPPEPVHFLERYAGGILRPFTVAPTGNEPDLDAIIQKLVLTTIDESEQAGGKRLTRKMLKDCYTKAWKEIDDRITGAAIDRVLIKAMLNGEIHEVRAKNNSGKAAIYLTLIEPAEVPTEEQGEPEREPEGFKPEEPVTTGKNELPVLN